MKIVWDEPKRLSNIAKHGYDFADLTAEFFESAAIEPSHGGRRAAYGMWEAKPLVVIYKPLGTEAVSVISMHATTRRIDYG